MSTTTLNNSNALLNVVKAVLAASILVFVTGLTSCNRTNPVNDDDSALYAMTLPDADDSPSDVSDATETHNCVMHSPASDKRRIDDFGLRFLRRALHLTSDQKQQILTFHQQHEQCFKSALTVLRTSDSLIVVSYKPQYESIKANLAAGTIDTATARTQLRALSQTVRDALRNNPDRATAQAAFKDCRDTFIANVRSILTADQLAIFDQWVALHKR